MKKPGGGRLFNGIALEPGSISREGQTSFVVDPACGFVLRETRRDKCILMQK